METEKTKIFEIGAEGGGESIYQLSNEKKVISIASHIDTDDPNELSNYSVEYNSFDEYWTNFKSKNLNWYNFFLVDVNLPKYNLFRLILDLETIANNNDFHQKTNWYEKLHLPLSDYDKLFNNSILNFIKSENEVLKSEFNKGIFEMPELAITYASGKQIITDLRKNENIIDNFEWFREYPCSNGFIDLVVFKNEIIPFAFEFKLDNKYHEYIRDIQKLNKTQLINDIKLENKYFCSVKWLDNTTQCKKFFSDFTSEITNAELIDIEIMQTIHPARNNSNNVLALYLLWRVQ